MPIVAVCQFNSTPDITHNFAQLTQLLDECKRIPSVSLVVLPECFACLAPQTQLQYTESLNQPGQFIHYCQTWSAQHQVELILGGINITQPEHKKPFNTAIHIDHLGAITQSYQKMHLFDAILPTGHSLQESSYISAGHAPAIAESFIGNIGMSICYDVRFPELFLQYAKANTTAICVPAAFTHATGILHWEILLRARAIETQSYILAAAQVGHHYGERTSYGHAMIIDPFGKIIALKEEGIGVIYAEVDPKLAEACRHNMPINQHRHPFFN